MQITRQSVRDTTSERSYRYKFLKKISLTDCFVLRAPDGLQSQVSETRDTMYM